MIGRNFGAPEYPFSDPIPKRQRFDTMRGIHDEKLILFERGQIFADDVIVKLIISLYHRTVAIDIILFDIAEYIREGILIEIAFHFDESI